MKISENTKTAVSNYIKELKAKVEKDLDIKLTSKVFSHLRQVLTSNQHEMERAALIHSLEIEANEIGYTIVKLPKNVK